MTIEAAHYGEAVQRLAADPIVAQMAYEMWVDGIRPGDPRFVHTDGDPRFAFMQGANRAYAARGGTDHAHIGAVASALLVVLEVIAKGMGEGGE